MKLQADKRGRCNCATAAESCRAKALLTGVFHRCCCVVGGKVSSSAEKDVLEAERSEICL